MSQQDLAALSGVLRDSDCELVLMGPGRLPRQVEDMLQPGGGARRAGKGGFVPDREFIETIRGADLLVAPYRDVTQSGSATLAMTVGTPIIGYASGGLLDLLSPQSLVPEGDAVKLAERVSSFLDGGWDSYISSPNELYQECLAAWATLLEEI